MVEQKVDDHKEDYDKFEEDEYKEFKRVTTLFVNDSCPARMKSLSERQFETLFDRDTNMPKFIPAIVCDKKHEELKTEIREFRKAMTKRDDNLAKALEEINKGIKKNGCD